MKGRHIAVQLSFLLLLWLAAEWTAACQFTVHKDRGYLSSTTLVGASPSPYSVSARYDQFLHLGPYEIQIGSSHRPTKNCSHSAERIDRILQTVGQPQWDEKDRLDAERRHIQDSLFSEFGNYVTCPDRQTSDLDLANLTPWLLTRDFVKVSLGLDPAVLVKEADSGANADLGSRPHSDITSPDGLAIGMIVAEDPPVEVEEGKTVYENQVPVYDASGHRKFIRQFKFVSSEPIPKDKDFFLKIAAQSDGKMKLLDESTKPIIEDGVPRSPAWEMYPLVPRQSLNDDEADVTLRGEITEYASNNHNTALQTFDVDVPNGHFIVRQRSSWSATLAFFSSIPGKISTIETVILAILGFFRLGWIPKRNSDKTKQRDSSDPEPVG
jgi:hypothetical protein